MPEQKDEVVARLDTIIAILQLALAEPIERARQRVREDPVSAAILELTSDEAVEAGKLRASVAQRCKQSERTVSRRIAILLAQRALEQTGSGPTTKYRTTGLI